MRSFAVYIKHKYVYICCMCCTVVFIINATGACNVSKWGRLLQVFESKICNFLVYQWYFFNENSSSMAFHVNIWEGKKSVFRWKPLHIWWKMVLFVVEKVRGRILEGICITNDTVFVCLWLDQKGSEWHNRWGRWGAERDFWPGNFCWPTRKKEERKKGKMEQKRRKSIKGRW